VRLEDEDLARHVRKFGESAELFLHDHDELVIRGKQWRVTGTAAPSSPVLVARLPCVEAGAPRRVDSSDVRGAARASA